MAKLTIDIGAKIDGMKRGLSQASSRLKTWANKMQGVTKLVQDNLRILPVRNAAVPERDLAGERTEERIVAGVAVCIRNEGLPTVPRDPERPDVREIAVNGVIARDLFETGM